MSSFLAKAFAPPVAADPLESDAVESPKSTVKAIGPFLEGRDSFVGWKASCPLGSGGATADEGEDTGELFKPSLGVVSAKKIKFRHKNGKFFDVNCSQIHSKTCTAIRFLNLLPGMDFISIF